MDAGWDVIVQRAAGRYDVLLGPTGEPFDDAALDAEAPWLPLVRALLGQDFQRLYRGVLITQPRASGQDWHADGDHLFPHHDLALPAHCLNVFVPLVTVTHEIGATEFCPGSHRLGCAQRRLYRQDLALPDRIGFSGPTCVPELALGDALLFDFRLIHRGLPNLTDRHRPVLYLSYAAPWFRDLHAFPQRELFPLV